MSLIKASTPIKPPLHPLHSTLFDVPVDYEKGPASVSFDSRYLDLPNRRNDQDLKDVLRQEAIYFATHRYLRDRILVSRIRDLMNGSLDYSLISAEKLAKALHISPRTLHRQLKGEGTSLQVLKNEVRLNKAVHLLVNSQRPIKHIAQEVGFNQVQGFNRAFKQWTGKLPSSYRKG